MEGIAGGEQRRSRTVGRDGEGNHELEPLGTVISSRLQTPMTWANGGGGVERLDAGNFRGTAGMEGACLPRLDEGHGAPDGGYEPEEDIDEVDPDGVLHADDALVALRVLRDVHLAEDAEEHEVDEPDDPVDDEEKPALDPGKRQDDGGNGSKCAAEGGVDPFGIGVLVVSARIVEVLSVKSDDDDSHDELEEADY